ETASARKVAEICFGVTPPPFGPECETLTLAFLDREEKRPVDRQYRSHGPEQFSQVAKIDQRVCCDSKVICARRRNRFNVPKGKAIVDSAAARHRNHRRAEVDAIETVCKIGERDPGKSRAAAEIENGARMFLHIGQ